FAQDGPGAHKGFDYGRSGNPTRVSLEHCIAALEGGGHTLRYRSGCWATVNVLHLLRPGDHVVCGDDVYGGTFRIFDKVMKPMGIEVSFVDLRTPAGLERALTARTRMVWLESPTTPMLRLVDIRAAAELTRTRG